MSAVRNGHWVGEQGPELIVLARAPRRRLRVRWFMVTGYIVAGALCWFASLAWWAEQWTAFAVLFFAVTAIGYLLSWGRKR